MSLQRRNVLSCLLMFFVLGCASTNGIPLPSYAKRLDPSTLQWLDQHAYLDASNYGPQAKRPGQLYPNIDFMVAASGGGQRAASFTLGVLRELEEITPKATGSLLTEVDYFSTVSGGGWPVAAYLARRKSVQDAGATYRLDEAEIAEITKRLRTLRLNLFSNCLNRKLEEEVTRTSASESITLGQIFVSPDTTPDLPYVFANAAIHDDGSPFVFSEEYYEKLKVTSLRYCGESESVRDFYPTRLSTAIGTSASFPGSRHVTADLDLCRNAVLRNSHICRFDYAYVHLVDGGIYDNLGYLTAFEVLSSNRCKSDTDAGSESSSAGHCSKRRVLLVVNSSGSTPMPVSKKRDMNDFGVLTRIMLEGGTASPYSVFQRNVKRLSEALDIDVFLISFESIGKQANVPAAQLTFLLDGLPHLQCIRKDCEAEQGCELFSRFYDAGKYFKASYKTLEKDQSLLIELGRLAVRLQKESLADVFRAQQG